HNDRVVEESPGETAVNTEKRSLRSRPARICMPSLSSFSRQIFRAGLHDAQRVLVNCDDVDVIELEPAATFGVNEAVLKRLIYHDVSRTLTAMCPGLKPVRLTREYDLFLVHCNFLEDAWYAGAIRGWRDHCRTSICWVDELWTSTLPHLRYWLPVLDQFDHAIVGFPGAR